MVKWAWSFGVASVERILVETSSSDSIGTMSRRRHVAADGSIREYDAESRAWVLVEEASTAICDEEVLALKGGCFLLMTLQLGTLRLQEDRLWWYHRMQEMQMSNSMAIRGGRCGTGPCCLHVT